LESLLDDSGEGVRVENNIEGYIFPEFLGISDD
jgi:hypothetical protein